MSHRSLLPIAFLLFFLSGISGLVYQSVWSHYIGLVLGHAAYAQALVLAIFMGGMALGAWMAGRLSRSKRNLLKMYALLELGIALLGWFFHDIFVAYQEYSLGVVLPGMDSTSFSQVYQWVSATMIVGPQCILLGATFPLMSSACLRWRLTSSSSVLGGLYFTNSAGAALGAIASAFLLLPNFGMPRSMQFAAGLNGFVGLVALYVVFAHSRPADSDVLARRASQAGGGQHTPVATWILLLAAGITGATSFVYEIGWVRMLNQVLGASIHSFELMLAAFISGLAFGGLWINRRFSVDNNPIRYAGFAQIAMGCAAMLSLPAFAYSFDITAWLVATLPKTDSGYWWYAAGSGGIAMLVMFPAAFFAGMTLPLFTVALLRQGGSESAVGNVYAANTLGAILGVALAVGVLVPWFGLRLVVTLAGLADIALGLFLLWRQTAVITRSRDLLATAAASAVVLVLALSLSHVDPRTLMSGVYRTGVAYLGDEHQALFFRDGRTASIGVLGRVGNTYATITTNGKPDASLSLATTSAPTADEITMIMAAALPLVLHPAPEEVAIIGWGSGLTTHTVLGSSLPKRVDTIEIEPAMVEGARTYGDRVTRAYQDPRSQLVIEDARSYFATGNHRYDVIISEPSNPWVSGVAGLFTHEFYALAYRHLDDDGLLVQWLQGYELNDALLATMLAAIRRSFPEVDIYQSNSTDFLLVASKSRRRPSRGVPLPEPVLSAELCRVGLCGWSDFELRKVGNSRYIETLTRMHGAIPHSDFWQTVAFEAPRARFKVEFTETFAALATAGLPFGELLLDASPPSPVVASQANSHSQIFLARYQSSLVADALIDGRDAAELAENWPGLQQNVARARDLLAQTVQSEPLEYRLRLFHDLLARMIGNLPRERAAALVDRLAPIIGSTPGCTAGPALVEVYRATALRDAAAMKRNGEAWLSLDCPDASSEAKQYALLVAMLGAAAMDDDSEVSRIEAELGRKVDSRGGFALFRIWLLAWADRGES